VHEHELRVRHATIVFRPVEKLRIIKRSADISVRLKYLDGGVAAIDSE
jgi:hypothetical protein